MLGGTHASGDTRPAAVVGRDPRASGEFLEAAVVAGLAESGTDVLRLGVVPTPAVAYLTDALGADFGVMLSASHNPAPDNGIKFFARGGLKLPDHVEDEIEARMAAQATGAGGPGIPAAGFGRVRDAADEAERYLAHLLSTVGVEDSSRPGGPARPLRGWRVVVDCAHGAAYALAPRLLTEAGADVIAIGVQPDGININAGCGSTSLGVLQAAVAEHGADAGIAYDGDADRCLAVDAAGSVIDGDQILAILALALNETGRLQPAAPSSRRSWPISDSGSRCPRPASTSSRHRSATATSWPRCWTGNTCSAASSPATSSCSTTAAPATAC